MQQPDPLDRLAPKLGLHRSGAAWRGPCPLHGGRKSPFALKQGQGGRLLVHCHAGCASAAILAELRRRALLPEGMPAPPMQRAPQPVRDWSGTAQALWDRGAPIAGSLAERYLAARGCPLPPGDALRCLEAGAFGPLPCLMAQVTDVVTARPITLHFTRLKADGTAKAEVARPKLLLSGHRKGGGCIRLVDDAEVTLGLGVAEGIETALSVVAFGWAPVWATVDAGNLSNFPLLDGIEALTVFADHDPAGLAAARACTARWHAAGRDARILAPTAAGFDFADLNPSDFNQEHTHE